MSEIFLYQKKRIYMSINQLDKRFMPVSCLLNGCYSRIGQSLVEGLIIFLGLILLFLAIPWLGRLIDINLQAENASRYGAFSLSRRLDNLDGQDIKQKFFLSKEHQWRNRRQENIVGQEQIKLAIDTATSLSDAAQAGQHLSQAKVLRQEWDLQDRGIANVQVSVTPDYHARPSSNSLGLDAGFFERLVIPIQRHTAILTDAGHSDTDIHSHQRTGRSSLAWKKVASESYELGQHIQKYAAPVEGFERAQPIWDWLVPWAGKIPSQHLYHQ